MEKWNNYSKAHVKNFSSTESLGHRLFNHKECQMADNVSDWMSKHREMDVLNVLKTFSLNEN